MENSQDGKINKVLTYISTNNITESNDSGAKLGYKKIGIPSKSAQKKSKPEWEIQLETQIKKILENRPKW